MTGGVGGASGIPDEGVARTIIVETRVDAQEGVVGGCSVVVTGVKTDKGIVVSGVAVTGVISDKCIITTRTIGITGNIADKNIVTARIIEKSGIPSDKNVLHSGGICITSLLSEKSISRCRVEITGHRSEKSIMATADIRVSGGIPDECIISITGRIRACIRTP